MITPTLVEPTENHQAGVASGVWSTQDQLEARRGGVWPDASVANPDTLIENNFSTFLYDGTDAAQTITNNIDLQNKGGLIWTKQRGPDDAFNHILVDTERGLNKWLESNTTDAEGTHQYITSVSDTGYVIPGNLAGINQDPYNMVSWTFKKATKFFDVVTYTGNDTAGRTIAHSLGSVPGMILIKNLTDADSWMVYHRGLNGGSGPENYYIRLNLTNAEVNDTRFTNGTAPTSSVFSVSDHSSVNGNGKSYIAYIFAHETGSDSMIQCGNYTGNGSTTGPVIDLGFEPQFLMIKNASYTHAASYWILIDNMRGMVVGGDDGRLYANETNVETQGDMVAPTSTGFNLSSASTTVNRNNDTYIYMAIRRPNMATITDATKVFNTTTGLGANPQWKPGFPVDFELYRRRTGTQLFHAGARLTGTKYLRTSADSTQGDDSDLKWDYQDGFYSHTGYDNTYQAWMWKRAKGYFDVVTYTGTGSARTIAHGLGAAPEMMWVKDRDATNSWAVYYGDNTDFLILNDNAATADDARYWNDTTPTSSVFSVGTENNTNVSGNNFIAYLFSSLAGVSKIGSVSHSGSSTDVDCGFSAGAKLVMLKRTDATGDWYWWDSVRGIIAGNDPYLLLNSTAAQVTNTDLIDPLASGFQISGNFTDGDYIFYAIA